MSLLGEVKKFKEETRAMNRKLDQIIELLKMLVKLQTEDEDGDDKPETE